MMLTQDFTGTEMWVPKCGKSRKVTGSGFTNLIHVKDLQQNMYKAALDGATNLSVASFQTAFAPYMEDFLCKNKAYIVNG